VGEAGSATVALTMPPLGVPEAPSRLSARAQSTGDVRLTWKDESDYEDGFLVLGRLPNQPWKTMRPVAANLEQAVVTGLVPGGAYDFSVVAWNVFGRAETVPVSVNLPEPVWSECVPQRVWSFHGDDYEVRMCGEDQEGEPLQIRNLEIDSSESALFYFFSPDNAEVLFKLPGPNTCNINDHRWLFVAPATDLGFRIEVEEKATGRVWRHTNPKGRAGATISDVAAFSCTLTVPSVLLADAGDGPAPKPDTASDSPGRSGLDRDGGAAPAAPSASPGSAAPLASVVSADHLPAPPGEATYCLPDPVGTLRGGAYEVSMCGETPDGTPLQVQDYGLDSDGSILFYFFNRDNAEVLLKVLDACEVNQQNWVFTSPTTTLAFNLEVREVATGRIWTHRNAARTTAAARADTAAFTCQPQG